MNEIFEISNPDNYKILIQIKKNRKLRRNASYLTPESIFTEEINEARIFETIQSAEEELQIISRRFSYDSRPRIIIKYILPKIKS